MAWHRSMPRASRPIIGNTRGCSCSAAHATFVKHMVDEMGNNTMQDSVANPSYDLPNFPALQRLKNRPQWVAWRYTTRNGRPTKPPVNPHTGEGASHSDPQTWGTYEQAIARAKADKLAGVGYVITEDDDLTGADLDECRDPTTGELKDWAQEIVEFFETYTEVSPSGTGLRLIWRGKVTQTFKCDPRKVEVYRSLRYLTITGHHVPGAPLDILPAPQTAAALAARVEAYKTEVEMARKASMPPPLEPARASIHSSSGFGGTFFRSVNDAAMHDLSVWVPALFGARARFFESTRAYRISSRDLGRDLEEDLSIAPNGIVDFGVHDMGDRRDGKRTPIDIVLEFGGHATAKDAALWLCDRIGRDPASFGWLDQPESIFFKGGPNRPFEGHQDPGAAPDTRPIRTFDFANLVLADIPETPDYIEDNLLGFGGFLLIGGPPKAQK